MQPIPSGSAGSPSQQLPPGVDPTAVIGRRVLSFIVDMFVGLVVMAFFLVAFTDFEQFDRETAPLRVRAACFVDEEFESGSHICIELGDTIYFAEGGSTGSQLLTWGYGFVVFVVWQGLAGLTPGKLVAGLRTVNADGGPPGMFKAFLRHILWIVDLFPYLIPGLVGFITASNGQGHQRVGDRVANTYVVEAQWIGYSVGPGAAPAASGWGVPAQASSPQDPTQPQWDPSRNTHIVWNAGSQRWQQYDTATGHWVDMT